jgi:hypothetical protein
MFLAGNFCFVLYIYGFFPFLLKNMKLPTCQNGTLRSFLIMFKSVVFYVFEGCINISIKQRNM